MSDEVKVAMTDKSPAESQAQRERANASALCKAMGGVEGSVRDRAAEQGDGTSSTNVAQTKSACICPASGKPAFAYDAIGEHTTVNAGIKCPSAEDLEAQKKKDEESQKERAEIERSDREVKKRQEDKARQAEADAQKRQDESEAQKKQDEKDRLEAFKQRQQKMQDDHAAEQIRRQAEQREREAAAEEQKRRDEERVAQEAREKELRKKQDAEIARIEESTRQRNEAQAARERESRAKDESKPPVAVAKAPKTAEQPKSFQQNSGEAQSASELFWRMYNDVARWKSKTKESFRRTFHWADDFTKGW